MFMITIIFVLSAAVVLILLFYLYFYKMKKNAEKQLHPVWTQFRLNLDSITLNFTSKRPIPPLQHKVQFSVVVEKNILLIAIFNCFNKLIIYIN